MLTAEQITNELTSRLPAIEERLRWLAEREAKGTGYGPDTVAKISNAARSQLADLRAAVGLPAAIPPAAFDEKIYRG